MLGRQEDLRAAVPESDDFVRIRLDWQSESPSETKISQLNRLAVLADEQVLRFQVAVEYAVRMQEHEGLANLVEEALTLVLRERRSLLFHVLLEVVLQIFEDKVQLVLGE